MKDAGSLVQNIDEKMICAYEKETGSCTGDSGGPVTVNINGTHFLLGVVSWGYDCTKGLHPDIYQFVPKFVEWINGTLFKTGI